MNFDVKSYCKRIADADPNRFRFDTWAGGWRLVDRKDHDSISNTCHRSAWWRFIGPIAEETEYGEALLEAMFEAVCEMLGAAKEEAV